jgi:hypothetical protein
MLTLWVLGGTPLKFGGQKMQPTLGKVMWVKPQLMVETLGT